MPFFQILCQGISVLFYDLDFVDKSRHGDNEPYAEKACNIPNNSLMLFLVLFFPTYLGSIIIVVMTRRLSMVFSESRYAAIFLNLTAISFIGYIPGNTAGNVVSKGLTIPVL